MNGRLGTSNGPFITRCIAIAGSFFPPLGIGIESGIPTILGCLLQHVYYEGVQTGVESPICAILGAVEFGLEALEDSVSDDRGPNFIPQSVAGLLALEDIPLVALLENKPPHGDVSLPSHRATSTVEVKLCPEYFGSDTGATSWRHAIDQLCSLYNRLNGTRRRLT